MEWNGKMITDPAELPPELRPLLEDANHNGIPDLYEQGVRPIIINGKLYRSVEEVPEPFRAEVEKALAARQGVVAPAPSVEISRSFTINGQSYASLDEVPAEEREIIRQAMAKMIGEKPNPPRLGRAPSSREGSRPVQGSPDRVGEGGLSPPEPERGRDGEAERSERGGGGGWGAEGRSEPSQGSADRVGEGGLSPPEPERGRVLEPSQGSNNRVGEGGLSPPEPERGRVLEPSQGSNNNDMEFPWAVPESRTVSIEKLRSNIVPWVILAAAAGAGLTYLLTR